jgi:MHS family proline/betaine transporter-like MFS transporter
MTGHDAHQAGQNMTDFVSHGATAAPYPASAPLSKAMVRRIVFSSSVGNALEWFDFLVYGYFATIIAKQFFPMHDEWLSTLLAIATFGISFLMRPFGAVVLGIYGDRKGRKAALTVAIALMMVGTFTMAVMPPYASIGLAAPILVLLARLVQGFAVGGEFGSATAFMVEHSPTRRGYYASHYRGSLWFAAHRVDGARATEQLGLAYSLPVRPADWADWLLHSRASGRDPGVSRDTPRA